MISANRTASVEMPDVESKPPLPPLVGQADLRWYALYVRAQQERQVETWLERAGVQHFSPFISRPIKQRRSNLERTEIPLLPGYVFARFDPACDIDFAGRRALIVALPGVVHVVGRGPIAEPIPDIEVESLRILIESKVSVESIPLVSAGDYVRLVRGPLMGSEGYVSWVRSVKGQQVPRITVSVTMLGRSVSAEVDADWLERAVPCQSHVNSRSATSPNPQFSK